MDMVVSMKGIYVFKVLYIDLAKAKGGGCSKPDYAYNMNELTVSNNVEKFSLRWITAYRKLQEHRKSVKIASNL